MFAVLGRERECVLTVYRQIQRGMSGGADVVSALLSSVGELNKHLNGVPEHLKRRMGYERKKMEEVHKEGMRLSSLSVEQLENIRGLGGLRGDSVEERLECMRWVGAEKARNDTRNSAIKRICEARKNEMMRFMHHLCPSEECYPMNEEMLIERGLLNPPTVNANIFVCRYHYVHECNTGTCESTRYTGGAVVCKVSGRECGSRYNSSNNDSSSKYGETTRYADQSYMQEVTDFLFGSESEWTPHMRVRETGYQSACTVTHTRKKGIGGRRIKMLFQDFGGCESSDSAILSSERKEKSSGTEASARKRSRRGALEGGCSKNVRMNLYSAPTSQGNARGGYSRKRGRNKRWERNGKPEKITREEMENAVSIVHFLLYGKKRLMKDMEKLDKEMKRALTTYIQKTRRMANMQTVQAIRNNVINNTNPGQSTMFSRETAITKRRRTEIYAEWGMQVIKMVQMYMRESSQMHRIENYDYVIAFLYVVRDGMEHKSEVVFEKDEYLMRHMPLIPQLTPMGIPTKKAITTAIKNITLVLREALDKGGMLTSLKYNATLYLDE